METKSYIIVTNLQFSLLQNPRTYTQGYLKWLTAQRWWIEKLSLWEMDPRATKSSPQTEELSFLRGLEIKSYRMRLPWNVLTRIYNSHQHSETHLNVHRRQDKQKTIFQLSVAPKSIYFTNEDDSLNFSLESHWKDVIAEAVWTPPRPEGKKQKANSFVFWGFVSQNWNSILFYLIFFFPSC